MQKPNSRQLNYTQEFCIAVISLHLLNVDEFVELGFCFLKASPDDDVIQNTMKKKRSVETVRCKTFKT